MVDGVDQVARDLAREALARHAAHEQVCEQVRKTQEGFMNRLERMIAEQMRDTRQSINEIKVIVEQATQSAEMAVEQHRAEDRESFKGIYDRLWAVTGGGATLLIGLAGFLTGKLLHWF